MSTKMKLIVESNLINIFINITSGDLQTQSIQYVAQAATDLDGDTRGLTKM